MADKNVTPEVAVAKILSDNLESNSENHEVVRKNSLSGSSNKSTRNSKAIRRLRVSYVSTRHYNRRTCMTTRYTRSASLCLKGHWLEEAGFTTGLSVDVRVMPGCLVVTALPEETAMMQALTRTSTSLPEKEQEQVLAFLQGVAAKVALEKSRWFLSADAVEALEKDLRG